VRRAGAACGFALGATARGAIMAAMHRAPKTADLFHAPPEFLCERSRPVSLPLGGRIRPTTLRAFVRAMRGHGVTVQSARLGYDRVYAYQCFARAHQTDDAGLRSLAVELFEAFGRLGGDDPGAG
jgi:hypothetical protein